MPRYKVNRDAGWPCVHEGRSRYAFGEEFVENTADAEHGVTQGYLIRIEPEPLPESPIVDDPPHEERPFTKETKATLKK